MKTSKKGFTLIELVVVTVILGILASLSVPYYLKTVESSKASDAVAIGFMLATSYRMYRVDSPTVPLSGTLSNACNMGACSTGDTTACRLVRCNYVAKQDWNASAYTFTVGGGPMATARRKTGPPPGTNTAAYTGWGYDFPDLSAGGGGCTELGSTPSCPNF